MTQDLAQALAQHRDGQLDEAAIGYQRILAERPQDFEANFYLAQVRAAQRRLDEAYGLMRAAAAIRPDSAEAQRLLGTILLSLRRPHQAIARLQAADAIRPGHPPTLTALGGAMQSVDRLQDALAYFLAAVQADPEDVAAHVALAHALCAAERSSEALAPLERALALDPGNGLVHASLSSVRLRRGNWEEARVHALSACELNPELAEAHAALAAVLVEIGDVAQAEEHYARAIGLAPQSIGFHCELAGVHRFQKGDPLLEALAAFERVPALRKQERISLHFALGNAYAQIGETGRSFDHLLRGNALRRTEVDHDGPALTQSLALTAQVFSREFVAARAGAGAPGELPIFIVGMPRSGTTLIEQILASHPLVHAGGELPFFGTCAARVLTGDANATIEAPAMQSAPNQRIREVGAAYLDAVSALAPAATRITDKMPANANYVGLIHLALPQARIIHARRNPLDNCLSCFSINFTEGQSFTYDLRELGEYYRAYEGLMRHWRDVLPPGAMLEVQYEEVVADLEGQARRLLAFCGLPWDDACLAFYRTRRPVHTASATQVHRPIYATSVGKWRAYEAFLTPLFEGLGIDPRAQ
jgi:tetratricopeptide (TPR) repeat protein